MNIIYQLLFFFILFVSIIPFVSPSPTNVQQKFTCLMKQIYSIHFSIIRLFVSFLILCTITNILRSTKLMLSLLNKLVFKCICIWIVLTSETTVKKLTWPIHRYVFITWSLRSYEWQCALEMYIFYCVKCKYIFWFYYFITCYINSTFFWSESAIGNRNSHSQIINTIKNH